MVFEPVRALQRIFRPQKVVYESGRQRNVVVMVIVVIVVLVRALGVAVHEVLVRTVLPCGVQRLRRGSGTAFFRIALE